MTEDPKTAPVIPGQMNVFECIAEAEKDDASRSLGDRDSEDASAERRTRPGRDPGMGQQSSSESGTRKVGSTAGATHRPLSASEVVAKRLKEQTE